MSNTNSNAPPLPPSEPTEAEVLLGLSIGAMFQWHARTSLPDVTLHATWRNAANGPIHEQDIPAHALVITTLSPFFARMLGRPRLTPPASTLHMTDAQLVTHAAVAPPRWVEVGRGPAPVTPAAAHSHGGPPPLRRSASANVLGASSRDSTQVARDRVPYSPAQVYRQLLAHPVVVNATSASTASDNYAERQLMLSGQLVPLDGIHGPTLERLVNYLYTGSLYMTGQSAETTTLDEFVDLANLASYLQVTSLEEQAAGGVLQRAGFVSPDGLNGMRLADTQAVRAHLSSATFGGGSSPRLVAFLDNQLARRFIEMMTRPQVEVARDFPQVMSWQWLAAQLPDLVNGGLSSAARTLDALTTQLLHGPMSWVARGGRETAAADSPVLTAGQVAQRFIMALFDANIPGARWSHGYFSSNLLNAQGGAWWTPANGPLLRDYLNEWYTHSIHGLHGDPAHVVLPSGNGEPIAAFIARKQADEAKREAARQERLARRASKQ